MPFGLKTAWHQLIDVVAEDMPFVFIYLDILGPWRSGSMKSNDFTAKGISLHKSTSFEPFCAKIGWGLVSRGGPEKVRKSREAPIGMMCRR